MSFFPFLFTSPSHNFPSHNLNPDPHPLTSSPLQSPQLPTLPTTSPHPPPHLPPPHLPPPHLTHPLTCLPLTCLHLTCLPLTSPTTSPASTLCSLRQSPEPKGSESQPTPVTNKETLGSHLTTDRLGGSVQVLLVHAGCMAVCLCPTAHPLSMSLYLHTARCTYQGCLLLSVLGLFCLPLPRSSHRCCRLITRKGVRPETGQPEDGCRGTQPRQG